MPQNNRNTRLTPKSGGRRAARSPLLPAVVSVDSDIDSVASASSSGSFRTLIAKPVLKQLFYDIEHAGGIHEFDKGLHQALNILLDQGDPAIYGVRGDSTRKRLSNKVTQWKSLAPEKYLGRLVKLGLLPASQLPKVQIVRLKAKSPKKRSKVNSIPEEVAYDSPPVRPPFVLDPKDRARGIATNSEDVRDQILEQAQKKQKARQATTKESTMRGVSPELQCLLLFIAPTTSSPLVHVLLLACKAGNTTIIVDPSVPGDQGEGLHIFPITFKANDVLYEGFEVAIVCDVRDVHADFVEMYFKEGTNEAKFCKPALAAPYRLDKTELDLRILNRAVADTYIIDGRDAVRVMYNKQVLQKGVLVSKKSYEVLFPDGVQLSQRAFGNPIGKEGEMSIANALQYIHRKGIGAGIMVGAPAAEPDTYHCQMTWRFANAAKDTELTVAGARGAATVTASLAGL